MLSLSFHRVSAQSETTSDSADATNTGDSDEVPTDSGNDTDSADDDNDDSIDVTGDSDDSDDDTDSNTESDDDDDDDSDDDSDADGSNDDSDTDDEESGDGSDDSDDTESSDSDTATASTEDLCSGLASSSCRELVDDEGFQICAVNANTNNCYEIVASDGIYGKGNFDEGYTAAQSTANEQTQQLNTIVGVLGGIVGLLMIVAVAGAYYFYLNQEATEKEMVTEMVSDEMASPGQEDGTALIAAEEEM